jgi:hypothetical protein
MSNAPATADVGGGEPIAEALPVARERPQQGIA